ncbi:hypothetical protein SKAU_G00400480 [Synaphobranchus kaupii]|uniref:USP domain-containing protein n=1 Tax=Synaphobranchus kaupii TaxID=118154 RepID=A0A9Q1ICA2_SYNKA|nr:hypothetical protein SKAU_G00400480 [Synaphobranchus kaupii]
MFMLYSLLFYRLGFHCSRKIQEERISQDEIRRSRIDHTVLGFPNIGNTCYMNATLQSLFSLQIFIEDIRREESCWRANLPTHLLKCLADLHSAWASCSRERKISLLKNLKRTITANYSDFCGDQQQDAHEFLSVLLSQIKEEGVSLRTRVGLHPYTYTIESNFEFELLSTRTCLSCGDKVSKTESYNCLSVDLVPGGSVQDSLALYFKACEVECQCHWCYGQLSSAEQKLLSLPRVLVVQLKRFSLNSRGNLVKLHDRLHVSPHLCLQAHSRANVRRPGMPKPHLTQGDCYDTSFSPEGDVPLTAEKKSSVEGRSAGRIGQDSCAMNDYRITSVLSHIGSNMQHGHYICESSQGNTTWLSFDDERVQQMDQQSALRQRSNSAYILFYEYR